MAVSVMGLFVFLCRFGVCDLAADHSHALGCLSITVWKVPFMNTTSAGFCAHPVIQLKGTKSRFTSLLPKADPHRRPRCLRHSLPLLCLCGYKPDTQR